MFTYYELGTEFVFCDHIVESSSTRTREHQYPRQSGPPTPFIVHRITSSLRYVRVPLTPFIGSVERHALRFKPRKFIRAMRGDTRAVFVETSSGQAYVTKHMSNPLGRRVLASEWIGTTLMYHLGLPVPGIALITVESDLGYLPIGTHFGSRYPGDPATCSTYDFLPDRLLGRRLVDERDIFTGAIVFDLWTANTDLRQTIFYRPPTAYHVKQGLHTLFIDNSHLFGGPDWAFEATTNTGRYLSKTICSHIYDWSDFLPWIERIEQLIKEDIIKTTMKSIPVEWLTPEDFQCLMHVHNELVVRNQLLMEFIRAHVNRNPDLFPKWCTSRVTSPTHFESV